MAGRASSLESWRLLPIVAGDVELITLRSAELTADIRRGIDDLFHAGYRGANDDYLEMALAVLSNTAIARAADGRVVAFALGETKALEIPGAGVRPVSMAGLACVDRDWRRQRLFSAVATAALQPGLSAGDDTSRLVAGRVAHAASLRSFRIPNAVPRPGVAPTAWHKQVGAAVAEAYGASAFDADRFICIGDGVGPGEPVLDIDDATEEERRLFEGVNRARGDALLRIGWWPDPPPGW